MVKETKRKDRQHRSLHARKRRSNSKAVTRRSIEGQIAKLNALIESLQQQGIKGGIAGYKAKIAKLQQKLDRRS